MRCAACAPEDLLGACLLAVRTGGLRRLRPAWVLQSPGGRGTGGVVTSVSAVGLRGEGRLNQHWRLALGKTGTKQAAAMGPT